MMSDLSERLHEVEKLKVQIERLREWNAEIALNAREFAAENERLRAALHDLVVRCMDDFNGGRKLRRGDVDRARAALEGRTCTCHPSEAPTTCQRKYALGECTQAAVEGRT